MSKVKFTRTTDLKTGETHYFRHDSQTYGGMPGEGHTEELSKEEWETERELYAFLQGLGQ